jgi:hypothetical protein
VFKEWLIVRGVLCRGCDDVLVEELCVWDRPPAPIDESLLYLVEGVDVEDGCDL